MEINFFEDNKFSWREISDDALEHRLKYIESVISNNEKIACYTFGLGGLSRQVYDGLDQTQEVELVFKRSVLPIYLRLLGVLFPHYSGLVKITDISGLIATIEALAEQAKVIIYLFPIEFSSTFENNVQNDRHVSEFGVELCDRYLVFGLDTDASFGSGIAEYGSWKNFNLLN